MVLTLIGIGVLRFPFCYSSVFPASLFALL
jgi:hypothetical protein